MMLEEQEVQVVRVSESLSDPAGDRPVTGSGMPPKRSQKSNLSVDVPSTPPSHLILQLDSAHAFGKPRPSLTPLSL